MTRKSQNNCSQKYKNRASCIVMAAKYCATFIMMIAPLVVGYTICRTNSIAKVSAIQLRPIRKRLHVFSMAQNFDVRLALI